MIFMGVNKFVYNKQTKFDISDTTAAAGNVTNGLIFYDKNGDRKTGTHVEDTPSVTVNTSTGLISATANGKTGTSQLTTQATKTVTPSKTAQTAVSKNVYTLGAVTVAAIPSDYIVPTGDLSITANGSYDIHDKASVTVNVSAAGTKNVQAYIGTASVSSTSYTATAVSLTVAKTGTYTVTWMGWRSTNSGTSGSQLYIGNTAYGSATTSFTNTYGQAVKLTNVSLTAGQTITVRARARSTSYVMAVGNLIIQEQ